MSALLDALDYVGSAIDKPGRAVRGMIGGRPGEMLAALPFSDSLGWTDRANAVSGQDIMRQAGASTGTEWGDALGGIGVEMATDPLNLFGAGIGRAVGSGLGKAAARIGPRYGTTLDDLAAMQRVGGEALPATRSSAMRSPLAGASDDAFELQMQSPARVRGQIDIDGNPGGVFGDFDIGDDALEETARRARAQFEQPAHLAGYHPDRAAYMAEYPLMDDSADAFAAKFLRSPDLPPTSSERAYSLAHPQVSPNPADLTDMPSADALRNLQKELGRVPGPPPASSTGSMPAAPRQAQDALASTPMTGSSPDVNHIGARLREIMESPESARLLSEIPPNSQILNAGAEAIAFRTPTGDVLRIGMPRFADDAAASALGRPIDPSVLQATRTLDVPGAIGGGAARVERTRFADYVGDASVMTRRNPETMMSPMGTLRQQAKDGGLSFWDDHLGNAGLVGGAPKIIDPGAVRVGENFAGGFQDVTQAGDANAIQNLLLRALGGDDAIRAAIEAGRAPSYTNQLTRLGAGIGATAGEGGRLLDRGPNR